MTNTQRAELSRAEPSNRRVNRFQETTEKWTDHTRANGMVRVIIWKYGNSQGSCAAFVGRPEKKQGEDTVVNETGGDCNMLAHTPHWFE